MYSPKINEELVIKLYRLKQRQKIPMTKMVNEAITEYLIRKEVNGEGEKNNRAGDAGAASTD